MERQLAQPVVCGLLLAAMAYDLGAAPCGCWEHSGWRAAMAFLAGDTPDHHGEGDHADHDDCEALPDGPAILAGRQALAEPDGSVIGDAWASLHTPIPRAASRSDAGAGANTRRALPVRAKLQVFRL